MSRLHQLVVLAVFSLVLMPACGVASQDDDDDSESSPDEEPATPSATTSTAGGGGVSSSAPTTTETVTPMARPDELCGTHGFAYLHSVYFWPECRACHGNGDFASTDPAVAYPKMVAIEDQVLLRVVTTGQFCTGRCRLEEGDATLADLKTWLSSKEACP